MIAGSLELQLYADVARLANDMEKAKRHVSSATQSMEQMAAKAKNALGMVGVGLSVGAIVAFEKSVIDATAKLDDMAEITGATVESLSALRQVARVSGQDMDGVAGAMTKLAKNLAGVDDESRGAGNALKAIGLDLDAVKKLKADEQMQAIAKAMNQFEDGTGKAAVAQVLLSKSGAALLPFLKDLAEWGDLNASVTAKQAAEAEQAQKAWNRLKSELSDASTGITNDMLPAINDVLKFSKEVREEWGVIAGIIVGLGGGSVLAAFGVEINSTQRLANDAAEAFKNLAKAQKDLREAQSADSVAGIMANNPLGAWLKGMKVDSAQADVIAARKALDAAIKASTAAIAAEGAATEKGTKARLEFSSATDKASKEYEALQKKAAEYIKTLEKETAQAGLTAIQKKAVEASLLAVTLKTDEERMAVMKAVAAWALATQAAQDNEEAIKANIAAANLHNQVMDEFFEAEERARKATEDAIGAWRKKAEEIEFETSVLGLSNEARERAIVLHELEAKKVEISAEEYAKLKKRVEEALESRSATRRGIEEQADFWRSIENVAHQTWDSVADGNKDMWERLKQSGKNIFFDWLYQMTLKKWIVNVSASISGAGAAGQAFGAAGGGAGSIIGGYNTFNALTGNGLGYGIADAAQWLSSGSTMGPAAPGTFGQMFAGAGAVPNWQYGLAGLGGGLLGGALGGSTGSTLGSIGATIGMAASGPIGAVVGSVIGGLLGGLFGGGSSQPSPYTTSLNANWQSSGIWSSSTVTGPYASTGMSDAAVLGSIDIIRKLAKLAISAGFSTAYLNDKLGATISATGTAAGFQDSLTAALNSFANETMRRLIPDVDKFAAAGESLAQTFERLISDTLSVRAMLKAINQDLKETGADGVQFSEGLIQTFGGLQNLQGVATGYYEAFFTQQERNARVTQQVTQALAALGLQMPTTREGFRALVEAQDLTTKSGQGAFAALLGLAPAFASVVAETQAATDAINDQSRAQEALRDGWQRTADSIMDTMRRLRGQTDGTAGSFASVQAQFAIATAAARAGSIDAANSLPGLAESLVEMGRAVSATRIDQAMLTARTLASLSATVEGMRQFGIDIPQFAVGTSYVPADMTARIHAGEEITPRPYVDAQRAARDETNALLRGLVSENQAMRAEITTLQRATERTASAVGAQEAFFRRISPDGNSINVTVAA